MKYEDLVLGCPRCGKPPKFFGLFDGHDEVALWKIVCPCNPGIEEVNCTEFETVADWNQRILALQGKSDWPPVDKDDLRTIENEIARYEQWEKKGKGA